MPTLSNPKYERFARAVSEGKSGVDAYLDAGHQVSRKVAAVNASRLMQKSEIKARIADLRAQRAEIETKATQRAVATAVEELAISKERTLRELASVAYAGPLELAGWGEPSARHLQAKVAALEKIARCQGLFIDRKEIGQPGDFDRMDDAELDQAIAEQARELADLDPSFAAQLRQGRRATKH